MRFPSPGIAAAKSSPEAVFKLTLVSLPESEEGAADEFVPVVVIEELEAGVALAHADSTIIQSKSSEIKVDFRFILFSKFVNVSREYIFLS